MKVNGHTIRSAQSARAIAEASRERVLAVNPNTEGVEETTAQPIRVLHAEEREESKKKHQKFLGYVDPAGNPSHGVFSKHKIHAKCGGQIYSLNAMLLGAYLECAKCGGWGVKSSVASKQPPKNF